ncbi:PREDICTED: deoxyhypusine hydroxylase [Nicrophorus vespilloides]|uniref:Deoxyhypusine hydroxylase n=1 Tax=Nicrophorus vespilloides TaxID=110193 RepID=A0ABM1MJ25_NICVS|nr:PREDICTED: deoxyhypusine hydroxylase [Nicrophorus vespilloides]
MLDVSEEQISKIGDVLKDENRPLKERFRALFTLRNIGGPKAVDAINVAFADPSALLKHELAYCLGQMQDKCAINVLVKVLEDTNQEPMVRHEAAEALGAIGSKETLDILRTYLTDPIVEVKETCELALERIQWLHGGESIESLSQNIYNSVDPAPPASTTDVTELRQILLNPDVTLFNRYRAMFSLRNINSKESIAALCEALKHGSALFKHEIAFVLGQLQDTNTVPHLTESLRDVQENEMVRHECAEALGAIATQECLEVLQEYLKDSKRVVKESCEIALDMCEYENSPEFQYANTLKVA